MPITPLFCAKIARKLTLAVLVGGLSTGAAQAADLPSRNSYAGAGMSNAYNSAFTNWGGFYAGLHLGYGSTSAKNAKLTGFKGGAQLGYNHMIDRWVVGAEGDLAYSGIDYRGFADSYRQKWLGSLRGKGGYSFDRFLPYLTAGFAFTNAQMSATTKDSNSHTGLVLGVGGDVMITDKIFAGLSFLHYRFGTQSYNVGTIRSSDLITNELRASVNYRF